MSEFSDRLAELMNGTGETTATSAVATPETDAAAERAEHREPGARRAGPSPARLPGTPPATTHAAATTPAMSAAAAPATTSPEPTHAATIPGGSQSPTQDSTQTSRLTATAIAPSGAAASSSGKRGPNKGRFDDLKENVHEELLVQLGPKLYDANLSPAELESMVRQALTDVMAASNRPLTGNDRQRITQEIADDILGYGPLEPYLRDDSVSEVMVNGPFDIWLERKGRLVRVDGKFNDEAHLRRTIDKIVSRIGRRIDESSPMVDARLPDGSRVNAVVPPLAIDGSSLTIRKFSRDPLTAEHLIDFGTLSRKTADFLEACVRGRLNVVVSGGTGAGKTTTLNVLSSFIPDDERIVTIEDAAELQLKQDHVVRLESRPSNIEGKGEVSIRDLVRNSLRMRPDRIVVGEVRDASALDMLQAMNTGHDGSICTVHSNGPRDTLARLETLVLMAGMDLPMRAIREQVASAVDMIVHQARLKDGTRRITHVTEVERMEGDVITLQDIFMFDNGAGFDQDGRSMGTLKATGLRPKFLEKMAFANVEVDPRIFVPESS
ncbi:MAG: putative conjugal transfer protein [Marmoricola sp.]|nr:putative conjugal transfer protein [Marmoricola sp.]